MQTLRFAEELWLSQLAALHVIEVASVSLLYGVPTSDSKGFPESSSSSQ